MLFFFKTAGWLFVWHRKPRSLWQICVNDLCRYAKTNWSIWIFNFHLSPLCDVYISKQMRLRSRQTVISTKKKTTRNFRFEINCNVFEIIIKMEIDKCIIVGFALVRAFYSFWMNLFMMLMQIIPRERILSFSLRSALTLYYSFANDAIQFTTTEEFRFNIQLQLMYIWKICLAFQ